jgi:hypothetical protein
MRKVYRRKEGNSKVSGGVGGCDSKPCQHQRLWFKALSTSTAVIQSPVNTNRGQEHCPPSPPAPLLFPSFLPYTFFIKSFSTCEKSCQHQRLWFKALSTSKDVIQSPVNTNGGQEHCPPSPPAPLLFPSFLPYTFLIKSFSMRKVYRMKEENSKDTGGVGELWFKALATSTG